jgi:glycosyltransferase involved in cell wall biosynthesis
LRAAKRVSENVPDATFIIAGEGELMEATQELAESLGIADRTFFIGRCQDVGAVLSISDVCVLSSRSEGFSNAILEYMAAGRPVVATDVGGAREAIVHGESGFITSLLLQPELARSMGECGKRIVTEKFSSQKQLQNVESLYSELLKSSVSLCTQSTQTNVVKEHK